MERTNEREGRKNKRRKRGICIESKNIKMNCKKDSEKEGEFLFHLKSYSSIITSVFFKSKEFDGFIKEL
jgi:hypothetical protein